MNQNEFENTVKEMFFIITELIDNQPESKNLEIDELNNILYINSAAGQYVINKHNPTKQIWLSSPKTGGHHFNFSDDQKWYNRHNSEIIDLLHKELGL